MNEDQFNRLVRRVDRLRGGFFVLAMVMMVMCLYMAEVI